MSAFYAATSPLPGTEANPIVIDKFAETREEAIATEVFDIIVEQLTKENE